jgi:hypothetical protein
MTLRFSTFGERAAMLEFLATAGLFVVGIALGIVWFSVIVLPIFYGLPRAILWCARGWTRWSSTLAYMVSPILWTIVFFAIVFAIVRLSPKTAAFLSNDPAFSLGQMIGIGISILRSLFSRSTHADLDIDFQRFMTRFLTAKGLGRWTDALSK